MQYDFNDLISPAAHEPVDIPLLQGQATYYPQWLTQGLAQDAFATLQNELDWRQDTIRLYGREVKIPRLQAWYGESHCAYQYSGLKMTPLPWHPTLLEIKRRCEDTAKTQFNCVLANWYRYGQDSMSMHSDNEPELGTRPVIASVTLGAARNFDFKHKNTSEKHRLKLEHGSLLVMAGDTQTYYNHGINKTKQLVGPRINLTYRYIQPT